MTAWHEFSPADFDRTQAARGALKRDTDQGSLFFVATPTKAAPAAERAEMPGQEGLFSDDETGPGI